MKKFLLFLFTIIVLIIGIYIGSEYSEYKRAKEFAANMAATSNTIVEQDEETNTIVDDEEKTTSNSKNDFIVTYEDEEYVGKTKSGIKVGTNKRNIPTIKSKSNQEAADKIASKLTKISDKFWDEIIAEMDEYVKDHEDITNDSVNDGVGIDYIISTGDLSDNVITFNIKMSGSMGGTGWSGYEGYNFDLETGELLKLKDVAKDYSNAKKYIVSQIEKELEKQNLLNEVKDYLKSDNTSITKKLDEYEDSGIWYFEDGKFVVTMPKYSIGYGALGLITVEIDGDDFNEYLKDEYKIK